MELIERRDIVIVAHDVGQPRRFEVERDRIAAALGARAVTTDRIGCTSVPGLAAKPIVHIDLTVADVDDESADLPDILAAGYELRVREPGHRMARMPARDVHVHVTTAGSGWARRDLLPGDPGRAQGSR